MTIKRRIAVILGTIAVAIGVSAAPALASTGYHIESSLSGQNGWGVVSDGTSGDQVYLQSSSPATFTRINFVNNGGTAFYEYEDNATSLCLKEDPSITHHPIVELACTTTGTTAQEERISDPDSSGNMQTLYDVNNSGAVIYTYTSGISAPLLGTENVIGGEGWKLVSVP